MSPTELIPLLVLVLALLGASGATPATMDVVFEGTHDLDAPADVVAVGGGDVTVPANATIQSEVFVIGGNLTIAGTVDGAVRVFAGSAEVRSGGTVTGELQTVSGEVSVAPGATVERRTSIPAPTPSTPAERVGALVLQLLVGGTIIGLVAHRHPAALENVGAAMTDHALVSGVVGALAGLTLLVLFVYMAFTLLLLPVSLFGILGEVLLVGYAFLCWGAVVGRRLPIERPGLAAPAGFALLLVGLELVGFVPILDVVVTGALAAVGLGALLVSYVGLRRFQPAEIPG